MLRKINLISQIKLTRKVKISPWLIQPHGSTIPLLPMSMTIVMQNEILHNTIKIESTQLATMSVADNDFSNAFLRHNASQSQVGLGVGLEFLTATQLDAGETINSLMSLQTSESKPLIV